MKTSGIISNIIRRRVFKNTTIGQQTSVGVRISPKSWLHISLTDDGKVDIERIVDYITIGDSVFGYPAKEGKIGRDRINNDPVVRFYKKHKSDYSAKEEHYWNDLDYIKDFILKGEESFKAQYGNNRYELTKELINNRASDRIASPIFNDFYIFMQGLLAE